MRRTHLLLPLSPVDAEVVLVGSVEVVTVGGVAVDALVTTDSTVDASVASVVAGVVWDVWLDEEEPSEDLKYGQKCNAKSRSPFLFLVFEKYTCTRVCNDT